MNAVLGICRLLADTTLSLEQQQYVTMINNSGHLLLTIINGQSACTLFAFRCLRVGLTALLTESICLFVVCLLFGTADILDYSKIEAGQLRLSLTPHSIVDAVESAIMLVYDMAATKGLMTTWRIDPNLPPTLIIDPARLQQVLLNLLSNAIKFSKVGGVQLTLTGKPLVASEAVAAAVASPLSSSPSSSPSSSRESSSPSGVTSVCSSTLMRTRTLAVGSGGNSRSSESTPPTSLRILEPAATATPAVERWQLSCSIRDSGIGISAPQMQLLFQTFSQVQHMVSEQQQQQ